jgi:hypothetical protein
MSWSENQRELEQLEGPTVLFEAEDDGPFPEMLEVFLYIDTQRLLPTFCQNMCEVLDVIPHY